MTEEHVSGRGPFMRQLVRLAGRGKSALAVVGFAALAGAYYEYSNLNPKDLDSDSKKKILVIPFHRLKVTDNPARSTFFDRATSFDPDGGGNDTVQMDLRELIDVIHHAASDPEIVALYGIFGHGSHLPRSLSFAQLEEIRNALRVFRESHRLHSEPNYSKEMQIIPRIQPKPLYAYTDTFASPGDPSNKEYYLASIFTHIHMQRQGELNFFGPISENFFLRGLLEKYGITLHVFKHGQYKNFPNMFTEKGYNRAHKENVTNILMNINEQICDDIVRSRSKTLTGWLSKSHLDVWQKIQSGTFTAPEAWKAGLLDFIPRRDPLLDLLKVQKSEEELKSMKDSWELHETDIDQFKAEKSVSLQSYARKFRSIKKSEERREAWSNLFSNSTGEGVKKESIALLNISGPIGDSAARKLVKQVRKIRSDDSTKCVVVRVSSPGGSIFACETISQELKALEVPVIFSFGSVAASGGYYIASNADRIFASGKSVTGSIGVFALRADLTGLAAKYGINTQAVPTSELSGIYSPFINMSNKMKQNIAASVDRYYSQFKDVVSEGRRMPLFTVEALAQGRVWTGEQAKENGLIDEVGGLHRALAYAKRNFTETGNATVVLWPKDSWMDRLRAALAEDSDTANLYALVRSLFSGEPDVSDSGNISHEELFDYLINGVGALPSSFTSVLACDEKTAVQLILEEAVELRKQTPTFPNNFWV